ncbi:MAG: c-type cytochrome [Gemmataceae bacterium]
MRGSRLLWAGARAALFAASPLQAQPKTMPHPVLSGYERLFADDKADPVAAGQLLLTELSCVNCHTVEGGSAFLQRQGPTLTDVGSAREKKLHQEIHQRPACDEAGHRDAERARRLA